MSDKENTANEHVKRAFDFAVTPSQLLPLLEHLLSTRDLQGNFKSMASVMIWGAMGIGKTDIVRTLGDLWDCRIVALHLAQFDPTDLKGIPVRMEDGKVVWIPSSYLPQFTVTELRGVTHKNVGYDFPYATGVMVHIEDENGKTIGRWNDHINGDLLLKGTTIKFGEGSITIDSEKPLTGNVTITDKAIIFLDELSAAVPEVQNAALQLCLDGRVGEYDVPKFVPIVAAGNREIDGAFVHPMSAPLANRFCHVRLTVSTEDWIEYAMLQRVSTQIIGYIQWKGQKALFHFNPDDLSEGDLGFPTPRSWCKLSEQMNDSLQEAVMNAVITGFVGKGTGQQFIAYRKICEKLPNTDDILQGKKVVMPDEFDIGAKYGLAMALCYKLEEYHDRHFDDKIDIDEPDKQRPEWRTATRTFCDFIDKHLGREMTVLCVHIVSKHLGISFTKFKGTEFPLFARKYRNILRKTV